MIALTDNIPWITALANDVSYDSIFSEQLENHGQAGDLLIAISGSGNSANVLNAVDVARASAAVEAPVWALVEEGDTRLSSEATEAYLLPVVEELWSPLVYVLPLQLFTYFLALARGTASTYSDHGMTWDNTGKNGHYAPFEWSWP